MPLCFSMETEICKQSFRNIKTCISHCQIFLHHSPQEGNLGMKINSLLTFTFGDLHFRLAFPWYSYSPTLKFRQLDMSSDEEKDKKGQNLPLSSTAKQGESRG